MTGHQFGKMTNRTKLSLYKTPLSSKSNNNSKNIQNTKKYKLH